MENKKESGVVVVEATIVVTLVMMLITIMLFIGIAFYQQTATSVMANQTASNIAQVYSNTLKDPFTGYIDVDHVYQSITYSNIKTDAYMDVVEKKANAFAKYRLKSSQLIASESTSVDVEIASKPNELLKNQIIITIRDKYNLPLVSFFGPNGIVEFEATGRADCVDILEYFNGVDAIADPESSPIQMIEPLTNPSCLVTFVLSKDSGTIVSVVPVFTGKSIISSNRHSHSTMPTNPKNGNVKFTGWKTENGAMFYASTTVNRDITVYGCWECQITLDPNGGQVSPTTLKVEYGNSVNLPTPTRPGFVFNGWKDTSGNMYNGGVIKDNMHFVAQWTCTHRDAKGNSKIKMIERKQYLCQDVGGAKSSYELYKCSDCSYNYKTTIENKHYIDPDYLVNTHELLGTDKNKNDFVAQCDVNHLSSSQSQTSGHYGSGFSNGVTVNANYHITCKHCGMHSPEVYWTNINGSNAYKHIYWTSNSNNRIHTACRTPDVRFN